MSIRLPVLTMLLAASLTTPTQAQISCADVEFGDEVKDRYPLIDDACLGIVERDGQPFARLHARVDRVDSESITIEYLHSDGIWGPYVEVTPPDDFRPVIGGIAIPWRELEPRQETNIYVPHDRWALAMTGIDEPEIVVPTVMEIPHVVAATTASAVAEPAVAPVADAATANPATAATPATAQASPEPAQEGSAILMFLILAFVTGGLVGWWVARSAAKSEGDRIQTEADRQAQASGVRISDLEGQNAALALEIEKLRARDATMQAIRGSFYPVENIEGIGPTYGGKLRAAGIENTQDLLQRCCDSDGRENTAETTGLMVADLLKWSCIADLMRVKGIGEEWSELIEAAGAPTVDKLAGANPTALLERMAQINENANMTRRLPTEAELGHALDEAAKLTPAIQA